MVFPSVDELVVVLLVLLVMFVLLMSVLFVLLLLFPDVLVAFVTLLLLEVTFEV